MAQIPCSDSKLGTNLTLMDLPTEILSRIIDELSSDLPTLCTASLTNKKLADHCQRLLFRTISLPFWAEEDGPRTPINLLTSVVSSSSNENSHLPDLIRSLTLEMRFGLTAHHTMTLEKAIEGCESIMCSLLQHLTSLESLSISSDVRLRTLVTAIAFPHPSHLCKAVHTSRLTSICFGGITIDISQSWLATLPELRNFRCEWSWIGGIQDLTDELTPLPHLESFEYTAPDLTRVHLARNTRRMKDLMNVIPLTSLDRLKHFAFASPYADDYPTVLGVLTAVAPHLESFAYRLPNADPQDQGAFEDLIQLPHKILDPGKGVQWGTFTSLRRFTLRLAFIHCCGEWLRLQRAPSPQHPQHAESTMTAAIRNSIKLSACPMLSEYEIYIINIKDLGKLFDDVRGPNIMFQLGNTEWEILNRYLSEGMFPHLTVLRLVFELEKMWTPLDVIDEMICEESAGDMFCDAVKRGIKVEVDFRYDSDFFE